MPPLRGGRRPPRGRHRDGTPTAAATPAPRSPHPDFRTFSRPSPDLAGVAACYVRGEAWEILIVWAVSYATFAAFGLNDAMLLALAVGLSVIVPYIGALLVSIPVALIAWFQWGWSPQTFWLISADALIQVLDGNVLVPLLFSEVVDLHPVAIIVAILVFGGIWGFWGVFFAIPLATVVQAILLAWPRPDNPAPPSAS